MKSLILSNKDITKRGGSSLKVYQKFIDAVKECGIEAVHKFAEDASELTKLLATFKPDIVFSGAYYTEDGVNVHALLESEKVPYIGSTPDVLELVISKARLKERWNEHGIRTPEFLVVRDRNIETLAEAKNFPYLVKPSKEGNSRGMDKGSVVYDQDSLKRRVELLCDQGYDEVLVEKYLGRKIRELTIGTLGEQERIIAMPAELKCRGERPIIVTTELKDEPSSPNRFIYPIVLEDEELRRDISDMAAQMANAAGIRDYSRCDIIIGEDGMPYAIEINGQSQIESYYITGAQGIGLNDAQARAAIFLAGITRNQLDIPPRMQEFIPDHVYSRLANNE